jgi:hypothetical protein
VISAITAFGFGVWAGPHLTGRSVRIQSDIPYLTAAELPAQDDAPVAAATPRAVGPRVPRATRPVLAAASTDLHARLKPVLNRGTNMQIAAEGFRDGQQFATVAHAARNTEVPFALLKHRVLSEGKSLTAAIRESKPAVDAAVQAELALAQARADIATIQG